MDPCYRAVAPYIPEGSLTVDLGSGMGLLVTALAELGGGRRVHGIEHDARKHRTALRSTRGLQGVKLELGDLRALAIPPCERVTCLDVLHYFEVDEHREILRRIADALPTGGLLLMRETDGGQQGGTRLTRPYERLAMTLGWNRGASAHFRSREAWVEEMEAAGFDVVVEEASNRMNPGNLLLIGTKVDRPA